MIGKGNQSDGQNFVPAIPRLFYDHLHTHEVLFVP